MGPLTYVIKRTHHQLWNVFTKSERKEAKEGGREVRRKKEERKESTSSLLPQPLIYDSLYGKDVLGDVPDPQALHLDQVSVNSNVTAMRTIRERPGRYRRAFCHVLTTTRLFSWRSEQKAALQKACSGILKTIFSWSVCVSYASTLLWNLERVVFCQSTEYSNGLIFSFSSLRFAETFAPRYYLCY